LVRTAEVPPRLTGQAFGKLKDVGNNSWRQRTYEVSAQTASPEQPIFPMSAVRLSGRVHGTHLQNYSGGRLELYDQSGQSVGVVSLEGLTYQGINQAPAQGPYSYKVTEGQFKDANGLAELHFATNDDFTIEFSRNSDYLNGNASGKLHDQRGIRREYFIATQPATISPYTDHQFVIQYGTFYGTGFLSDRATGSIDVVGPSGQKLSVIDLVGQSWLNSFSPPNSGLYRYRVVKGEFDGRWGTAEVTFQTNDDFKITFGP
jgi:hypothetical protein